MYVRTMGLLDWILDKKRDKEIEDNIRFAENFVNWDVEDRVEHLKSILRNDGYDEETISKRAADFERSLRQSQAEVQADLVSLRTKSSRDYRREFTAKKQEEEKEYRRVMVAYRRCTSCKYYYSHVCSYYAIGNPGGAEASLDQFSPHYLNPHYEDIKDPDNSTCSNYEKDVSW